MIRNEQHTSLQTEETHRLLRIGDVFTSPKLAYGYREDADQDSYITIDGMPTTHVVGMYRSQRELLEHAAETGEILPERYDVDYSAHDPSRALAHFVVTRTEHPHGSYGMGGMDQGSPEEHIVWAQRLAEQDTFDPDGETITFNQMGWGCNITPEDVVILQTLRQWFM